MTLSITFVGMAILAISYSFGLAWAEQRRQEWKRRCRAAWRSGPNGGRFQVIRARS